MTWPNLQQQQEIALHQTLLTIKGIFAESTLDLGHMEVIQHTIPLTEGKPIKQGSLTKGSQGTSYYNARGRTNLRINISLDEPSCAGLKERWLR